MLSDLKPHLFSHVLIFRAKCVIIYEFVSASDISGNNCFKHTLLWLYTKVVATYLKRNLVCAVKSQAAPSRR